MTTVRIVDGMKYGFKFLGLVVALLLVCGAFVAGGAVLALSGIDLRGRAVTDVAFVAAGTLIGSVGVLAFVGAAFGLVHKFVADSVLSGLEAANVTAAGAVQSVGEVDVDGDATPGTADAESSQTPPTDEHAADAEAGAAADEGGGSTAALDPDAEGVVEMESASETGEDRTEVGEDPQATAPDADSGGESHLTQAPDDAGETVQEGVDTRPSSPEVRTWQRERMAEAGDQGPEGSGQAEVAGGHAVDETGGPGTAGQDADGASGGAADEGTGADETGGGGTDEGDSPADSSHLWDDEDDGRSRNIDELVSRATEPEPGEERIGPADDDGGVADDAGGQSESPAVDEASNIDEAPGDFVAKPPADTEGEAGDDDPDDDAEADLPDEPITDVEIEDTTDEEGDWEPLDEDDL
jgi:hypothetical protein